MDPDKIVWEAVNAAREHAKDGLVPNGLMTVSVIPDQSIDINLTVARHLAGVPLLCAMSGSFP